jgi:hypothetical protein
LQHVGRNRHVGDDEGEHGGHIGRDHARALGDAVDFHFDAVDVEHRARQLGKGVGGHDGLGWLDPGRLAETGRGFIENAGKFAGRQGFADNAGRSEEYFAGLAAQSLGGVVGGQLNAFLALGAGKGIGIARIDDEAAGFSAWQVGAAPVDGSGRAF